MLRSLRGSSDKRRVYVHACTHVYAHVESKDARKSAVLPAKEKAKYMTHVAEVLAALDALWSHDTQTGQLVGFLDRLCQAIGEDVLYKCHAHS